MNARRLFGLAVALSAVLLLASPPAQAQVQRGAARGYTYYVPRSPSYIRDYSGPPSYRWVARPSRGFVPNRRNIFPHNHLYRDWSTGRENLPLAKPWLHGSR